MDKQQLLEEVKNLAATNQLTRDELTSAFESGKPSDVVTSHHFGISEVLYYIGGGIVFIGIGILVGQNWEYLNSVSKILVTLGSSIAAYSVGLAFNRAQKTEPVGQAFFFISALLLPMGILVTFDQTGVNAYTNLYQTIVAAICMGVYLSSYFVFRKNLFHVFTIIFGTWLFFALTNLIVGPNPVFDQTNFFLYRGLAVGVSFVVLGHYFSQTESNALTGPLYAFGILAALGTTFALQRFSPNANAFWEVIYPGIVFAVIFLSTKLKSKAFLTFGAIFLMGYILKITGEYFSEGLGWPTSLVIAGLALIAVGYYTLQIKNKYLA